MHSAIFTTAALLASFSNAHMMMATPTPFGVSTLNNSPLAADGSDFPCKQRGPSTYDAAGASNQWPVGSTQTLSFKGSAVHGGGSCQVSLTTDKAPTKDTKWMVIHSIVGGCPSNSSNNGNLPANPDGTSANKYSFTVPDSVAAGTYVMAWTWFNRIGNREMYMNCAPVTVTGGASKKRGIEARKAEARNVLKREQFPDMFVANIGNGCHTSESVDVQFPNPGDSIAKDSADGKLGPPTGSCTGSSISPAPGNGNGNGNGGSPVASSSSAAAANPTTAPTNAPPPPPAAVPTTLSSVVAAPSMAPSAPVAVQPPVASSAAAAPAPSAPAAAPVAPPANGSSSGVLTGACTTGDWNCFNNGLSFQQCGAGQWSVAQSSAAGVPCKVGTGSAAPW